MLNEVLTSLKNNFYRYTNGVLNYSYTKDLTFTASSGKVAGAFTSTFLVGEYIRISDSRLNDGVYLISAISTTEITIDTTLDTTFTDEAEIECIITKIYIPNDLVALIAEIKTYNTNNTSGLQLERQGNREIRYAKSSGWKDVFLNRLSKYRKLNW